LASKPTVASESSDANGHLAAASQLIRAIISEISYTTGNPERASEFIGPFFTGKARMLRVFPMRPVRVEAAAHHDEEDGAASARTFRIMPIRQSLARR